MELNPTVYHWKSPRVPPDLFPSGACPGPDIAWGPVSGSTDIGDGLSRLLLLSDDSLTVGAVWD